MNLTILSEIIAFGVALTVHEFAHAFAASRLGDLTAKYQDRLSLNPLKHIDPFGTVILPLLLIFSHSPFFFGWAKPVPVNPYNLKGRYGMLWVSLAGPAANFLVAILIAILFRVAPDSFIASFSQQFVELFLIIALVNINIGIFNLIPVPPLDGSQILMDLLPPSMNHVKEFLQRWGFVLLMGVILLGSSFFAIVSFFVMNLLFGGLIFG